MLVYIARCIFVIFITWVCIRLIGKKSISQMTSYDLAVVIVLANITAEPVVYKNISKQLIGALTVTLLAIGLGWLSLKSLFYNADAKPSLVIVNGRIDQDQLRQNRINLPFLLSLLRIQGYFKISEVEFAIIEPNGNLSVIPKSQNRPVTPKDMGLSTQYEGLALPLIVDGKLQTNDIKFAKLNVDWLMAELAKLGVGEVGEVLLAELDTEGNLYVNLYQGEFDKPAVI